MCILKPLYTHLHVGQTCCRWNQDRRHVVWNMCLQGSFLHLWTISSLHMMQTVLAACNSSTVASGYLKGGRARVSPIVFSPDLQSVEVSDGLMRGQNVVHTLLEVSAEVKQRVQLFPHCPPLPCVCVVCVRVCSLGSDEYAPCDVERNKQYPHHEHHVAHVDEQLEETCTNDTCYHTRQYNWK